MCSIIDTLFWFGERRPLAEPIPRRGLDPDDPSANNQGMSLFLARSLVVACNLILALPPGWCCLVPVRQVETPSQPQQSCCRPTSPSPACTCCHPRGADHSNSPAEHVPPIKNCCCSALISMPPSGVDTPRPDLTASTLLLVADADQPGISTDEAFGGHVFFSTRSLQLLHCVWRC